MQWQPKRNPDFNEFLHILNRDQRPDHLPVYEHLASSGFIGERMECPFADLSEEDPETWRIYVDFWLSLGCDGIPMEIMLNCPLTQQDDTTGKESIGSESTVMIRSMEDFEQYPWPDESQPIEFRHFETAAQFLPEGAKIIGGVGAGPYEWSTYLLGVEGLALASCIQPELLKAVYGKLHKLYASAIRQLVTMECIGATRQGDDLGFKTATFLPPAVLREYIFPIYKDMVELSHDAGRHFILHSCGNLAAVYDDLIDDCGIDAKHSYEDTILPVGDFKRQYGDRVTALGGLDVDKICRLTEDELRAYTRKTIEDCFEDGFWALGTGNSLTDYMPVDQYLIVLDEAEKVVG